MYADELVFGEVHCEPYERWRWRDTDADADADEGGVQGRVWRKSM